MARAVAQPSWPGGAEVCVSLTFDVDAECGWLGKGDQYAARLTTLSEARFGVVRGVPRILDLLGALSIPATFYVPGDTAERHPGAVETIAAVGHEIGHHGHMHLRSDRIGADEQRAEIERGLAALESTLAVRPSGYRSPSWEMTRETFALLGEYEFEYDSSCMGDDRPYIEEVEGRSMLEFPVHWSLDDWPYFAYSGEGGGNVNNARDFEQVWLDEFESARRDGRHLTYTMHPEVIGRGYRIAALRRLLEEISGRAEVWFATHRQVADRLNGAGAG
ncbi:MAG: polysaccharide deacetylase family protein [Solirubrobacterales bacterium]|nr:polysaccharide deacetylase family protein [Solirubrobacterales bacterium]